MSDQVNAMPTFAEIEAIAKGYGMIAPLGMNPPSLDSIIEFAQEMFHRGALFDIASVLGPKADDELTYEVWQDDMMVASSTCHKDASHYAAVYSQDGDVKVYTVLRRSWEGLSGGQVYPAAIP